MTTQTEVLKMALEAMQQVHGDYHGMPNRVGPKEAFELMRKAITAVIKALAQQSNEQVEPVAVVDANDDGYFAEILPDRSVKVGQFLFAHPPVPTAQPELQTCNCRWDGDVQVQQCTLHEAHVDAIHEWAERAKTAEAKLKAQPKDPEQEQKMTFQQAAQLINEMKAQPEQERYSKEELAKAKAWAEETAALLNTPQPKEPEQEPVAWIFQREETGRTMCVNAQQLKWGFDKGNPRLKKIAPLYTTPPQRKEPEQEPVAKVVSTAPKRIWLDLGFDASDEDEISFNDLVDVTWSHDNATGYGIEYVRADIAARGIKENT